MGNRTPALHVEAEPGGTTVRHLGNIAALGVGALPGAMAYAAMLGLGLHRHAEPWVISLCATILVFGPPMAAAAVALRARAPIFGLLVAAWSVALLAAMPVYFPGERRQAVVTGMSLVNPSENWESLARQVAENLPEEPLLAKAEVPEATEYEEPALPPAGPLSDHEIALPYEGAGRRLSLPVSFQQGGRTVEREMMVDTGATYTTLPLSVLAELGVEPGPNDPTIVLHTANGEREARVVLVDAIWLGDLKVEGVAIATCEACASSETVGLLGLNVTGNYNLTIDADRREVVFSQRTDRNRRLDVSPFTELAASLSRYPGGRIEVEVTLDNRSSRAIEAATAEIRCNDATWTVDLQRTEARATMDVRRRLPEHEPCDRYQVALLSASW